MDMTAALACPLLHTATVMLEQRCVFTPTSESTAFHDSGDTMAPWPLAAAIRAAAKTRAEAAAEGDILWWSGGDERKWILRSNLTEVRQALEEMSGADF